MDALCNYVNETFLVISKDCEPQMLVLVGVDKRIFAK